MITTVITLSSPLLHLQKSMKKATFLLDWQLKNQHRWEGKLSALWRHRFIGHRTRHVKPGLGCGNSNNNFFFSSLLLQDLIFMFLLTVQVYLFLSIHLSSSDFPEDSRSIALKAGTHEQILLINCCECQERLQPVFGNLMLEAITIMKRSGQDTRDMMLP